MHIGAHARNDSLEQQSGGLPHPLGKDQIGDYVQSTLGHSGESPSTARHARDMARGALPGYLAATKT